MSCNCKKPKGCATEYEYAIKTVSGVWAECAPGTPPNPVAPGAYFTAINIHNPSKCDMANVRWKVVEAPPFGSKPIAPRDGRGFVLRPDYAIELDNPQILAGRTNLKGFVVLYSPVELDVVAVYSGAQGGTWPLAAFHTERVPAREVSVCEDMDMSISTGIAPWRLISPQAGPAYLLTPAPGGLTPAGSQWIGAAFTDGQSAPANGPDKWFELSFNLCYGFRANNTVLQVNADDTANLFLNGAPIGTANLGPITNIPLPATGMLPGENKLQVQLRNTGAGGNGFALAGRLYIAGGRCPCDPIPRQLIRTDWPFDQTDFNSENLGQ
jgi:hypothetical protein